MLEWPRRSVLAATLVLALAVAPPPALAAEPACPPRAGVPTAAQLRQATLTLLDGAREGFFVEYASEMVLAGYAKGANKPIATLETTAIQRAAINNGRPAEQLGSIETLLGGLEQGTTRKELAVMAEAWA